VHVFRSTRYNFGSLLEYYCAIDSFGPRGIHSLTTCVRLRTDPLRDCMPRVTLRYELRRDSSVKVVRRNRVADLTSVVGMTIE